MFIRHSWVYQPDTLSIALTTAAVLTGLLFIESNDDRWYVAALVLLVLDITNHMWEAIAALPLVVLFLRDRRWIRAGGVVVLTLVTIPTVIWLTELQLSGASTLYTHGTHSVGLGIFLTPGFWLAHLDFHL